MRRTAATRGIGHQHQAPADEKPPAATHDHAVRSFTRAAIATGLAAIDRGIRHGCG